MTLADPPPSMEFSIIDFLFEPFPKGWERFRDRTNPMVQVYFIFKVNFLPSGNVNGNFANAEQKVSSCITSNNASNTS